MHGNDDDGHCVAVPDGNEWGAWPKFNASEHHDCERDERDEGA
jgi:hypothetical protein